MPFFIQGKTNWKYILIVVILAVIVGGGISSYMRYFNKEIISISQFPEIKRPKKVEDETANWKTYRNEEYGFEIKYPEGFSFLEMEGKVADQYLIIIFSEKDVIESIKQGLMSSSLYAHGVITRITLYKNEGNLVLSDWVEEMEKKIQKQEFVKNFQKEEVIINNNKGIKCFYTESTTPKIIYYFSKGGIIYEFSKDSDMEEGGKLDKIFYQMLSTFKFLE